MKIQDLLLITNHLSESHIRLVSEFVSESASESVSEPVSESVSEPISEPVSEPDLELFFKTNDWR